jgi:Leucine-rich repeat (LRR) protein
LVTKCGCLSFITHFVLSSSSVNNDLDGTIPAQELSLLSHLAVLNLSFNTLTGFFELSKLPVSLEHVSFVANQFQTILEEKGDEICTTDLCNIGRLVNLKSLRLSIKKEEIDFDSSWMVQQIDVLGMIPSEIGKLTNLELLALEDVVLFGTLPTELGRLTQLTHLALSHNQLTGFVPSQLSYLTALEVLYLESNLNLKGNLEGLCGAAESSNRTTTMDFSSDCLYGKISCTCCQKCCHPWEGCEDMLMLVQEQEQIP